MVLDTKFRSLLVHTYQNESLLMIILSVRGQGKNLVIDRNSIVKKEIFKEGPFDVGMVEENFFRFFNFSNFFLKNGFNGTWQMVKETNS